jgi:hypothetical protein
MTDKELATWAKRSRAAQGLELTITDPAILARVVTLAFAGVDPKSAEVESGGADGT